MEAVYEIWLQSVEMRRGLKTLTDDKLQTTDDENRDYSYYKLTSEPKAQSKETTFILFLNTWVLSVYGDIWFLRRFLFFFFFFFFFYNGSHLGNLNHLNTLLFLHPIKASYENWLKFVQLFFFFFFFKMFCYLHSWVVRVHWTLVLEALGSIPMAGKKKFGDGPCYPYRHLQVSQVTEFEFGACVKINPNSSFEQITMGHSSQCYIYSFKAIILLVPEKKIFEDNLPYMVMAAIFNTGYGQLCPAHVSQLIRAKVTKSRELKTGEKQNESPGVFIPVRQKHPMAPHGTPWHPTALNYFILFVN